jgi:hypothetical protein
MSAVTHNRNGLLDAIRAALAEDARDLERWNADFDALDQPGEVFDDPQRQHCREKRGYESKARAKRAMRRFQTAIPGAAICRVYRCVCKNWHLTSGIEPARGRP